MNSLPAYISSIQSEGHLSLVKVNVDEDIFTTIVIDTLDTVSYLKTGNPVNFLFKETEVIIAKNFSGDISVRNRFACKVASVEKGKLLSKLVLHYKTYSITSIITTNAVEELKIAVNDNVTALVKTTEISLSPND